MKQNDDSAAKIPRAGTRYRAYPSGIILSKTAVKFPFHTFQQWQSAQIIGPVGSSVSNVKGWEFTTHLIIHLLESVQLKLSCGHLSEDRLGGQWPSSWWPLLPSSASLSPPPPTHRGSRWSEASPWAELRWKVSQVWQRFILWCPLAAGLRMSPGLGGRCLDTSLGYVTWIRHWSCASLAELFGRN